MLFLEPGSVQFVGHRGPDGSQLFTLGRRSNERHLHAHVYSGLIAERLVPFFLANRLHAAGCSALEDENYLTTE